MMGFWLLPILFVPAGYIFCIVSKYRLKENPQLKGRWLQLTAAILGIGEMLYLFHTLNVSPFSQQ